MTLHRISSAASHTVRCGSCGVVGPRGGACTTCGEAIVASKRLPPRSLLGSYRVDEILGEGAMGIVYLATHVRLDRRVAIKVLRSEYADNEQALRRFFAEARAVNTIAHPNVIEITDFVERPGDDNYYVMELLEGASLAALVAEGGIPSLQRSVAIMSQVASALAAVHEAGIVHRDLKPDNIVLMQRAGNTDFVKLVDFGVAKLVGSDDRSVRRGADRQPVSLSRTSHGTVLGTPEYMSPQQASGQSVDHRGDIYSFGAVLYELVTGRLPHEAESFGELLVKQLTTLPAAPRSISGLPHEVPEALEDLTLRCLAVDPDQRPPSIEDVLKQLEKIAEDHDWLVYELNVRPAEPPRASGAFPRPVTGETSTRVKMLAPPPDEPAPVPSDPAPPSRPRRQAWPIAAATVLAALAIVMVVLLGRGRSRESTLRTAKQVEGEIALADARVASGRLVGPGGDEALDHLLAARRIDPEHPGVRERLLLLAGKFQQLADQAVAAGSLAEAAAHLQVLLVIEPDDAAAAARITEIEEQMLARQRRKQ